MTVEAAVHVSDSHVTHPGMGVTLWQADPFTPDYSALVQYPDVEISWEYFRTATRRIPNTRATASDKNHRADRE